ncbi:MAG: AAA family ATPase [Nitrospira sp.]|nr:AAA family ATPase [bacterium]MBL7048282.1 AAA family ATPase [Nitrospira sp.]
MDFLNFFGLKEDPFKLTPDPVYFYPSANHNEGLLLMDYSIEQKEGFILIIGDPGTGKTTMLKVFLEKWKAKAEIAMVLTPRLSPEEFLTSVAEDLNIELNSASKHETIKALRDFMAQQSAQDRRVIIIVDEAQNLSDETLEELRLLSNLETDKDKLLQIVLIGQPELALKLAREQLRQLNQRITSRINLNHLNAEETQEYINFRIIKAGKENLHIDKKAARSAYRLSKGVPRLINMLMSRALMAAYLEEKHRVAVRHIEHAVKSLNHSEMVPIRRGWLSPVWAALAVAAVIGAVIYLAGPAMDYKGTVRRAEAESSNEEQVPSEPSAPVLESSPYRLVTVNVALASVRSGPAVHFSKAGTVFKGSRLVVLSEYMDDRNVRWYKVQYQGEKRWISSRVVEIMEKNSK